MAVDDCASDIIEQYTEQTLATWNELREWLLSGDQFDKSNRRNLPDAVIGIKLEIALIALP